MKQIQIFITTFIGVITLPLPYSYAQEMGNYVEQYEGRSGTGTIKIKLLRVGDKADEEVLIQVLGVNDELDSLIYKYKKQWINRKKRPNEYSYVTNQIPGEETFSLFQSDISLGKQVFKIYLPNRSKDAIEIYPASRPEDLDPRTMYELYLEQRGKLLKNGLGLLVI